MKTDNDYLAKYVRQTRPEIEHSLHFIFWSLGEKLKDVVSECLDNVMRAEKEMYIPDNFDAYDAHEREQEKWLESRPKCAWCGEPIQEEYAYRIDDEWVCEQCIDDRREYID